MTGGRRSFDLVTAIMPDPKIGRLWKFKKDEVDGWVRSGQAAD